MTQDNLAALQASEHVFVVERVFNAPRELVFDMWSSAEHLQNWWGPKGWTLPVCTIDFRAGGIWHYQMVGPNGEESWGKAVYQEVVKPERLVYLDTFSDSEGNQIPGTPALLITAEFVAQGDKTKVISQTKFATAEELAATKEMGMAEGFAETWDRLEAYLSTKV